MADMLQRALLLAAPFLGAACASVPRAYAHDVGLAVNLFGGYQAVDQARYDGHPLAGLELVTHDPLNGWGYELGGQYGAEDEETSSTRHEGEFGEVYLGMRRSWERGSMRPYVGFGGSWARVTDRRRSPTPTIEVENDSGGGYARAGVLWNLERLSFDRGTQVLVGFDVRGLLGEDLDGIQAALVLGFGR